MRTHERIDTNPDVMFGKSVVRGTRITVEQILRELGEGSTVAEVIEKILRTGEFAIEDGDAARFAHRAYADGSADFADCLLAQTNLARGCDSTATFDRKAGRTAGFETIEAEPS